MTRTILFCCSAWWLTALLAGCSCSQTDDASAVAPADERGAAGAGTSVPLPGGSGSTASPDGATRAAPEARMARAIRESLEAAEGGSEDERDAVLRTLEANEPHLRQATGVHAQRLIRDANNTHQGGRRLVPPAID